MKKLILFLSLAGVLTPKMYADLVMHYPMEVNSSEKLIEKINGKNLKYKGNFAPEAVSGVKGDALRFDGYTTHAYGDVTALGDLEKMTVSMWMAPQTYPIVKIDQETTDRIQVAGNIDHAAKTGWAVTLGNNGNYAFEAYAGGWPVIVEGTDKIECYKWNNITVVIDATAKSVALWHNGVKVAAGKTGSAINNGSGQMWIGKNSENVLHGNFLINTFNGLIDDIEVYDTALTDAEVSKLKTDVEPDFTVAESRFAKDLLRPRLHGMPEAAWTNESHGLVYSGGKYHVFFQKNANGPFMTRLHWGHISSDNLFDWKEEKIAIAPSDNFDIKGCWSGCVFTDDEITGGHPNAIYTGVDYGKAMMIQAAPTDETLIDWVKTNNNPIVNGRPSGLSDDFRDPYFFRNGDNAYLIVGTSKGDIGATTLHRYDPATKRWSNDGSIFAQGESKGQDGRFWEMPNVTKMENGKWLFTVTPLETSMGVRTLYRVGDIDADGKFVSDGSAPQQVEMISRDGFGMLSPSIMQKDGKTIALGIVPDILPSGENYRLGWAHCYSLPREWSLDADNSLVQKPAAQLAEMRTNDSFAKNDFELSGQLELDPVSGRQVEMLGRFTVGQNPFGFIFFGNGSGEATLTYSPVSNSIKVDFTKLNRIENDNHVYNGVYSYSLPVALPVGSDVKLNLFIDGSILDLFVNDKWATSIRVFPRDADADRVAAFSEGMTQVKELKAWNLSAEGGMGAVDGIIDDASNGPVNVYTMTGVMLKHNVDPDLALDGLEKGLYIVGNRKVTVN